MSHDTIIVAAVAFGCCFASTGQDQDPVKILVDPEFETGLFAREPMVKDPVAFAIDPATGRIAVCESFRQNHGVEDNRSSPYWLLDDLAAQTVELLNGPRVARIVVP